MSIGVTLDEFSRWFKAEHGSVLKHQLARQVWHAAAKKVQRRRGGLLHRNPYVPQDEGLLPTWTALRYEMHTWAMPRGRGAGWLRTFHVCARRYAKKALRTLPHRIASAFVVCKRALATKQETARGKTPNW